MPELDYSTCATLIIEHTESFRALLKKMLKDLGAKKIDVGTNGKEAMKFCANNQYDIILCDFDLGRGKNGLHVLEELRANGVIKASCIFAMLTATIEKDVVLSCLEQKPSVFISKPFSHNELKSRLDRVLTLQNGLSHIIKAQDANDHSTALRLCEQELHKGTRFEAWCLKSRCELLFSLKRYEEAIKACRSVLKVKSHKWALLILGKSLCAADQHDEALEVFKNLYSDDHVSIDGLEAYDEAAKIYIKHGDNERAQNLLLKASQLSGYSIPRLRSLADICDENNDIICATNAYRNVAKHAEYSMHHSPENNLNFARSLTERAVNADSMESKIIIAEALSTLNKVNKSYDDRNIKVQSELLASQAYSSIQEEEKANQLLDKALEKYNQLTDLETSMELKVELVRTYVLNDRQEDANTLISELNENSEFNSKLAARIDRVSEIPVSLSGKRDVVKVNKKGIKFYKEKQFSQAIDYFNKALKQFPKHTGIRLNLAQAIIAQLTLQGPDLTLIEQCQEDLAQLDHLTHDDQQYSRLTELSEKINAIKNQQLLGASPNIPPPSQRAS